MQTALTCSQVFETHYLRLKRLSANTIVTFRANLRRWETLAKCPPVDQITDDTFDAFRVLAGERGYSNDSIEGSVNSALRVLRLAATAKLALIARAPDAGQKLSTSHPVKYTPSLADVGKFYEAATVARWPTWCDAGAFWRGVVAANLWTGLRKGDLFRGLVWESFEESAISVTAHKTGKRHLFPTSTVLDRHLEPLKGLDSQRVFPVGKCNHQILREVRRIADAAGVKRFGLQALRRRSCSNWQAAKWGAGEVVQGSAIKGSAVRYIVPEILQQAAPRFRWPDPMLTAEERDQRAGEERRIVEAVRRLGDIDRAAVLSLAEKLAT